MRGDTMSRANVNVVFTSPEGFVFSSYDFGKIPCTYVSAEVAFGMGCSALVYIGGEPMQEKAYDIPTLFYLITDALAKVSRFSCESCSSEHFSQSNPMQEED
jgi:hypothetical protein